MFIRKNNLIFLLFQSFLSMNTIHTQFSRNFMMRLEAIETQSPIEICQILNHIHSVHNAWSNALVSNS